MSLRSHTYAYAPSGSRTPSPPIRSPVLQPPSPSSPSRSVDARHHAQLATYKRDPARAAAANRTATLTTSWGNAGRRLSAVVEEAYGGHERKRRSLFRALGISGVSTSRRSKKCILYTIGLLVVYLTLIRPIFTATSHIELDLVGQASSGAKASESSATPRSKAWQKPFRMRRVVDDGEFRRAPLPPSLMNKKAPDHKIERGLLKVNSKSRIHPIYQLIRDARDEWDKKVAKQSKTLKEAVEEYRRRYGRQPPKGFDKWWEYVCDNEVPLPDEYDQIDRDLLPFRALSPRDLNARIDEAIHLPDTYTLKVRHGSVRTFSTYSSASIQGADERLQGQAELLKPIAQWLDDLTVVYSVHDTATALVGWDHRRELLEHLEDDEYFDEDGEVDMTLRGWGAACPPSSGLRNAHRHAPQVPLIPSTALSEKSFIASHSTTMDLCDHPELVAMHGALAGRSPQVRPLTPIFSLSKTSLHSDVLGVPTEQWIDDQTFPYVDWDDKFEDKLLWRGSSTGTYHSVNTPWRQSHRTRLLSLTYLRETGTDADEEITQEEKSMTMLPAPKALRAQTIEQAAKQAEWDEVNHHFMDLAFTGSPIQCDINDGSCEDLEYEYDWAETMSHEAALKYRYVIDVDGNAWSGRFKRLLTSGSLIFKSTIMPEWWTDRIQPWVHYVPIQLDYSDVYDALAFFRGDLANPHITGEPNIARDIAWEGKTWSETHWRKEDMTAYVFRLYLEWGRLVADRRSGMDFVYDEAVERSRV